jgi:hypothetical protein
MADLHIQYATSPTLGRFHNSDTTIRGIRGPRGSGKSTGCSLELFLRAKDQAPYNGIRRSRFAVVRNTYPELRDTTLKTWLQWFPESHFGPLNRSEMRHVVKIKDIEMEVLFRSLDKPGDISKLLSMELTAAWVNEAREIYARSLILGLRDAVGRFPPVKWGGPTWHGVIMDTNSMDTDHWWYRLAEEEQPDGWEFFKQPGGLVEVGNHFVPNPDAENLDNLVGGANWYLDRIHGASKDHIRIYYCNEYGYLVEGKPVYPEYHDSTHCPEYELRPVEGIPIIVGMDFGLTPAALFMQRLVNGSWIWFDELVTDDMGVERFARLLVPMTNQYRGFKFKFYGDPAGTARSQTDERTCYDILKKHGIKAIPAPTNDFTMRREAVAFALNRIVDGKPGLMISPMCRMARKAMNGGYHFKRVQVSEERYHEEPNKNIYSHVAEAGQYGMLGEGEGNVLIDLAIKPLTTPRLSPKYTGQSGWMY